MCETAYVDEVAMNETNKTTARITNRTIVTPIFSLLSVPCSYIIVPLNYFVKTFCAFRELFSCFLFCGVLCYKKAKEVRHSDMR